MKRKGIGERFSKTKKFFFKRAHLSHGELEFFVAFCAFINLGIWLLRIEKIDFKKH